MAERKLLFRPEEAAEALGVSRARVYELMGRGEIRSVKIGASRRVPAVDLQAYVARLRAEHAVGATRDRTPARATA